MSAEPPILHIWRGDAVGKADQPFVCLNGDNSWADADLTQLGVDYQGYCGILIHGGQTLNIVEQHSVWDSLRASKLPMALSTPKADPKWDPVNLAKLPVGSVIIHHGPSKAQFLQNPKRYVCEHAQMHNGSRTTPVLLATVAFVAAVLFQSIMKRGGILVSFSHDFLKIAAISVVVCVGVGACVVYSCGLGKFKAQARRMQRRRSKDRATLRRGSTTAVVETYSSPTIRSGDAAHTVEPDYWTNRDNMDEEGYSEMFYTNEQHAKIVQELLDQTCSPSIVELQCASRSVSEPKVGQSPKSPKVQMSVSEPSELPDGFVVRRVIRVEELGMWTRYANRRNTIKQQGHGTIDPIHPQPLTGAIVAAHADDAFEPLATTLNECYLWHGSSIRTLLSIARFGFDPKMHPRGFKLTESSSVADRKQLSGNQDDYYAEMRALLLCRVCIGKFASTEDHAQAKEGSHIECDGVVSCATASVREFIVYDADQLYPEYIVFYSRRASDAVALTHPPLHTELPVYWSNCHKNPKTSFFKDKVRMPPRTLTQLQHLVDSTAPTLRNGRSLGIVTAHRMECAKTWNTYNLCKQQLLQQLKASGASAFKPMCEVGVGRNALTHTALEDVQDFNVEDMFSLANLQPELNEMLLWHGTSHKNAESIIKSAFDISEGSLFGETRKVSARFGSGAYFADDIAKSLPYAIPDPKTKLRYFLLCRVTCGDFFYTDDGGENSWQAATTAEVEEKHSVLAQPPFPREPRPCEFVVWDEAQVYAEYILAVEVSDDCNAPRVR